MLKNALSSGLIAPSASGGLISELLRASQQGLSRFLPQEPAPKPEEVPQDVSSLPKENPRESQPALEGMPLEMTWQCVVSDCTTIMRIGTSFEMALACN